MLERLVKLFYNKRKNIRQSALHAHNPWQCGLLHHRMRVNGDVVIHNGHNPWQCGLHHRMRVNGEAVIYNAPYLAVGVFWLKGEGNES